MYMHVCLSTHNFICFLSKCHFKCVPRHHGMARPQAIDERDGRQGVVLQL
jgi:hypothetical protein